MIKRKPTPGWIRRGYLDALEGMPYEHAPGPERHPVDTAPGGLPERWSMYLAGLYLGLREQDLAVEQNAVAQPDEQAA